MAKKCATMAVVFALVFACWSAGAQGTAFSYQGFLTDNGIPAHGSFDLQFSLFGSSSGVTPLTAPVLTDDLSVTNGLFTVTLDFGAGQFTGAERWVEIGVRPGASTGGYTALLPRQPITPTPYAIFAGGVSAAGITGTIPAGNIGSGTITSNMLAPGAAAANLAANSQSAVPSGGVVFSGNDNDTNLLAAGYAKAGGYVSAPNLWRERTPASPLAPRTGHDAVWTGTKMLVWGGYCGVTNFNDGGSFDPASVTWSAWATNGAPLGRRDFSSTWTGSEMIVWGGFTYNGSYNYFNDGGRYNVASNTWTPTPTNDAPTPRQYHSAVWTGTEMIVWGGLSSSANGLQFTNYNDGARYNSTSNVWIPMSLAGAPSPRAHHTAVWTGSEMIIWGGRTASPAAWLDNGARYSPATDTWSPMTSTGLPLGPRSDHSAIWTGTEMVLWGGLISAGGLDNEGGRYNPTNDTCSRMDNSFAPSGRFRHTTVWTGREMIVWGGDAGGSRNDGGSYDPSANIWTAVTTAPRAPDRRKSHVAVWTGSEMMIFGGEFDNTPCYNDTWSCTPPKLLYLYMRP